MRNKSLMLLLSFILLFIPQCIYCTRESYYQNWMSIYDLSSLTLFDIVIPGSSNSGMYPSAIIDYSYTPSTDNYYTLISYLNDNNEYLQWTSRQINSIYSQLTYGSRYLDIKLEYFNNKYWAHNGLLGAELPDILDDISQYLTDSDGNDIILLNFNDFLNVDNTNLISTLEYIVSTLGSSKMANKNNNNIRTSTILDLLNSDVNIIAFYDSVLPGSSADNYFYLSNEYFNIYNQSAAGSNTNNTDSNADSVQQSVLLSLINGWDKSVTTGKFNQISYNYQLNSQSEFIKYRNLYNNYIEYNNDLLITFPTLINNYPKLFFANILIIDFIEISPIVDEVIKLNINYNNCRDQLDDCYDLTDLDRDYKDNDISSQCNIDTNLLTECRRSCGNCNPEWIDGVPGDRCNTTSDCGSIIYEYATGIQNAEGECFDKSYCLSPFPNNICANISADLDTCTKLTLSIDDCDSSTYCSSDYQCSSGYCQSDKGMCLGITTPSPTIITPIESDECYCPKVVSELAVDFRSDIEPFRPGDPDANYELVISSCNNPSTCQDVLQQNPYVESLIGFVIIPFILSIILFIMYCCCCMFWCCCQTCSKKKCCRCCLGDPEESMGARWGPTIIMVAVLITILWASIEGAIANGNMHSHLFNDVNDDNGDESSLRIEIINVFDTIIDKFEGAKNDSKWVVDNIKGIFNSFGSILSSQTGNIDEQTVIIYSELYNISTTFTNFTIVTTITDPLGGPDIPVTLECDYCIGLNQEIAVINESFSEAVSAVDEMTSILNESQALLDAEDAIDNGVQTFRDAVNNLTSTAEVYKANATTYLNEFESYDSQREIGGYIFFLIPITWIILWTIGVALMVFKTPAKMMSEWCFRCTWCPAMFLGATVMLIFSFFAIISVGWADFCVNLDEFENNPIESTLGQSIINFGGDNSSNRDNQTVESLENMVEIVNACWTGSDLLEVFNLTETLNWDKYRDNLTNSLNIDIVSKLTLDSLNSFITEVNLLNTDEFEPEGNRLLYELNSVDPPNCKCDCNVGIAGIDESATFTREKLVNNTCFTTYACWWNGGLGAECLDAFEAAYGYVNAEKDFISQSQAAIDQIQKNTNNILHAYDLLFGIAVKIENDLENISCSLNPIFNRFDDLITNYTSCGFLGKIYGDFKEVGCVYLFSDMYWISCAMMVIAFVSILIVCFGFMTQYSWHPVQDDDEELDRHDLGRQLSRVASMRFAKSDMGSKSKLGRQLSRKLDSGFGLGLDFDDTGLEKQMSIELGVDEGTGGVVAQPPPPSNPPPPNNPPPNDNNIELGVGVTNNGADINEGTGGVTGDNNNNNPDIDQSVSLSIDNDLDLPGDDVLNDDPNT